MYDGPAGRAPVSAVVASILDVVIATGAVVLLARLVSRDPAGDALATPILVLLTAAPVRAALGVPSWLSRLLGRVLPDPEVLRRRLASRVPALVDVLPVVAATWTATVAVAFAATLVFPPASAPAWQMPFEHRRFAETFAAWDSGWYHDIARRGYYFLYAHQSSVAFFPLYPMLIRLAASPFGRTDRAVWIAGIAVSSVAFVLALVALHRFSARVLGSRDAALKTVTYLAVFPFSLFYTRVYAESVFLLTTVLATASAWDRRWVRAGVWGALATLCRPNGILIGVPLALLAIELDGNPPLKTLAGRFAALLPVPLALAAYSYFNYRLSGDALAWLHAQAAWSNSIGHAPWRLLRDLVGQLTARGWYDYFTTVPDAPFRFAHGATALLFLALLPWIFKRLGAAMGAYVLVSVVAPLTASSLEGIGRYASVLFPAFMLMATVRSRRAHDAILIVSSLFLALFVCLFVTLRPIY